LEFNVPFQHKYGYIRDERHIIQHTDCQSTLATHNMDNLYVENITTFGMNLLIMNNTMRTEASSPSVTPVP